MARLTNEQLAEIIGRKGYGIAPGSVSNPHRNPPSLPIAECGAGNGPLAKEKAEDIPSGRFLVRVRVFRKRLLDADNCGYGIKVALDSCRYAGIVPDDRPQDIRLEICEQVKVETDEEERIEIEVYAPNNPMEAKLPERKE